MPDWIALTAVSPQWTRARYLLAALPLALLLAGSVLRNNGRFVEDLYRLQERLGGDKAVHLMAGFAVMAAGWLLCLPRSGKAVAAVFLAALTALSLDELVQLTMATRDFDPLDLAAGGAGAAALALAVAVLPRLQRQRATPGKGRPDT